MNPAMQLGWVALMRATMGKVRLGDESHNRTNG